MKRTQIPRLPSNKAVKGKSQRLCVMGVEKRPTRANFLLEVVILTMVKRSPLFFVSMGRESRVVEKHGFSYVDRLFFSAVYLGQRAR